MRGEDRRNFHCESPAIRKKRKPVVSGQKPLYPQQSFATSDPQTDSIAERKLSPRDEAERRAKDAIARVPETSEAAWGNGGPSFGGGRADADAGFSKNQEQQSTF